MKWGQKNVSVSTKKGREKESERDGVEIEVGIVNVMGRRGEGIWLV